MLLYFASHWLLALAAVLVVAGLSVAAYFLKNWKYAAAAVAVTVAGFLYQGAVTSGINLQIQKDLTEENSTLKGRLSSLGTIALKDNIQAQADDKLNTQLETLASETPVNNTPCLDAASAHRVWSVRNAAIAGPTTVRARRISNLLPWPNRKP